MDALKEKELFVPVDGAKLYCRVFGENKSPLIVMHGGPGLGAGYLLPQMAALEKFSSAIFYDQRGTGKSTGGNDWQSDPFQTYVKDVEQLRQAFSLEKVSLLGHSWGGLLASLYALAYPQHVDKIIFLNSVPLSSAEYLEFVKHRNEIVNTNQEELASMRLSKAFEQGDPKTIEKFYRLYFRNYFTKPEQVDQLTLKMSPMAAINNFKIYDLFYNHMIKYPFELYDKLRTLNKASLIVACDKDVIPFKYTERLQKNMISSKLALIKDCGHFPYLDQPKVLFEMLKDFIEQ